jgi:hypothetical protein
MPITATAKAMIAGKTAALRPLSVRALSREFLGSSASGGSVISDSSRPKGGTWAAEKQCRSL